MERVKVKFPDQNPLFTATIPVRIGDINYGNHLGNDSVLSIIHEARMQMIGTHGCNELNIGGNGLIMADVMIAFKGEGFYGDVLTIKIYAVDIGDHSFDLLYHISTLRNGRNIDIAHAKTGMVYFDYDTRKIIALNEEVRKILTAPQP